MANDLARINRCTGIQVLVGNAIGIGVDAKQDLKILDTLDQFGTRGAIKLK